MESTTKYLPAEERGAMTVQAVLALGGNRSIPARSPPLPSPGRCT